MKIGTSVLCILLATIALVPLVCFVYNTVDGTSVASNMDQPVASIEFSEIQPKELSVGSELGVKACRVIDGYKFVMSLEDGSDITAHLKNATTEDATISVIELLNKSSTKTPSIVLLRRVADYWIVDFIITVDGERSSLTDILRAKGLLL